MKFKVGDIIRYTKQDHHYWLNQYLFQIVRVTKDYHAINLNPDRQLPEKPEPGNYWLITDGYELDQEYMNSLEIKRLLGVKDG